MEPILFNAVFRAQLFNSLMANLYQEIKSFFFFSPLFIFLLFQVLLPTYTTLIEPFNFNLGVQVIKFLALFSFQFTGKCYVQGRQESFPRVIGELSRSAEMGDCHGQIRIRCRHTVLDIGRYFVCFYLRQHQSFQINRHRVTHMETCILMMSHRFVCVFKDSNRIFQDFLKNFIFNWATK